MMENTIGILMALWIATMLAVSIGLSFMPHAIEWVRRSDPTSLHQIPTQGRILFGFLARTLIVWFLIVLSLRQSVHYEVLLLQLLAAFLTGLDAGSLTTRLSNSDADQQRARDNEHRQRFNPLSDVQNRLLWHPSSDLSHTYTAAVQRLKEED